MYTNTVAKYYSPNIISFNVIYFCEKSLNPIYTNVQTKSSQSKIPQIKFYFEALIPLKICLIYQTIYNHYLIHFNLNLLSASPKFDKNVNEKLLRQVYLLDIIIFFFLLDFCQLNFVGKLFITFSRLKFENIDVRVRDQFQLKF